MKSKLDSYIEKKLHDKLSLLYKKYSSKGMSKNDIKKIFRNRGYNEKIVAKVLNEPASFLSFSKIFLWKQKNNKREKKENYHHVISAKTSAKEEKKHKEKVKITASYNDPKLKIAAFISIVFIIALGVSYVMSLPEKGNGSCPHVTISDVRKVVTLHQENRDDISFVEMEQILDAYFGRSDCTLIDSKTIKRLRKLNILG